MSIPERAGDLLRSSSDQKSTDFNEAVRLDLANGIATLPNGKRFRIKIHTKAGTEALGTGDTELSQKIIDMLNNSQIEGNFIFKDLSKTKIGSKGIVTNQEKRVLSLRKKSVITPKTFAEDYSVAKAAARCVANSHVQSPIPGPLAARQITEEAENQPALTTIGTAFKHLGGKIKKRGSLVRKRVLKSSREEARLAWEKVTLEEIDRLMVQVTLNVSKPVIKEGVLQESTKRGFHVVHSQVGTSASSLEIMENMIGKLHEGLIMAEMLNPAQNSYTRESVDSMLIKLETIKRVQNSIEVSDWAQAVLNHSPPLREKFERLSKLHGTLFDDYQNAKDKKEWKQLSPANLVLTLITPAEKSFRRNFLRTYRNYKTSAELFSKMRELCRIKAFLIKEILALEPDSNGNISIHQAGLNYKGNKEEILADLKIMQQGILKVCKQWLQDPFINNGEHLQESSEIPECIGEIIHLVEASGAAKKTTLLKTGQLLEAKQNASATFQSKQKCTEPGYQGFTNLLIRLAAGKLGDKEREVLLESMADALFKRDAYFLSKICSSEFVGGRWIKSDKEIVSPNIVKLTRSATDLTNYVQFCLIAMTAVSKQSGDIALSHRIKMLEFFIDIAERSIERGNFSSAIAIIGALNNAQVRRLTDTFEMLDTDYKEKLKKIEKISSSDSNFKHYRDMLAEAASKEGKAYIPYLGTLLTDYTFADDKPKTKEEDIVVFSMELLSRVLGQLAKGQQSIASYAKSLEKEGSAFFETEFDILGELESYYEKAAQILEKVAEERGAEFKEPMAAMADKFAKKQKIDDILYDQSVIIQPRKAQ